MGSEHNRRIEKLQSHGKNVLILNSERKDPNFFYLTGMDVDYGAIWIPIKGEPIVLISGMDAQKYPKFEGTSNIGSKLKEIIKGKTVHVNYSSIDMSQASSLGKVKDISKVLSEMRVVKSKEEIEIISENVRLTNRILKTEVFGREERAVSADINREFYRNGGSPAFDTIVAGGSNTSKPHHFPTSSRISKVCYIDAGLKKDGYVSDITRAFVTSKHEKYAKLLKEAIKASEDLIRPGAKCSELDRASRKVLGEYSKNFIHALGHGIGIEVHESPFISTGSNDILKKGMVITIEPGIYMKDFGLRIENDYIVTGNGFRRLTKNVN